MKNINLNNINDLQSLKESLNKTIDKKINEQKLKNFSNKIDTMSFGELKCIFESVSENVFENNKKALAEYVNTIKKNDALKTMYSLHESAIKPSKVSDANQLVNTMVMVSEGIDTKKYNNGLNKLRKVTKSVVNESNLSDDYFSNIINDNVILESLNYILTNKRNHKNLYEYTENFTKVVNYINENMKEQKNDDSNKSDKNLINDLNESFSDLETWQKDSLKDIVLCNISETSKESLFERYKNECLALLDDKISNCNELEESIRFNKMKEQLSNKKCDLNNINESIMTLSELKHTLSE